MGLKGKIKIVVILGPTSSGKSLLAVQLAKRFGGEIISADSRQIYKGMDLGSGKITKKEMDGIPHHLLSIANPKRNFSAAQYQKMAEKIIIEINQRGHLPIICGGSAFYLQSLTEGLVLPKIRPDWKLRHSLQKKNPEELYKILQKIDPRRASQIEGKNLRRLVRAIEIIFKSKKVVPPLKKRGKFNFIKIALKIKKESLHQRVQKRILERIKKGMIKETKTLKEKGLSWKRIESFGLEYRWTAQYLQKKITKSQMITAIYNDTIKLIKKQMVWFKKDKKIHWLKNYRPAITLVKKFLN